MLGMQHVWFLISLGFMAYISHSIYEIYSLYFPKECTTGQCIRPSQDYGNPLQLRFYTSLNAYPSSGVPGTEVHRIKDLDVTAEFERDVQVSLPTQTRRNGSLWLHVALLPSGDDIQMPSEAAWHILRSVKMTLHQVPQAKAFQLIQDATTRAEDSQETHKKGQDDAKQATSPVTHWRSVLPLALVNAPIAFAIESVPQELHHLFKYPCVYDSMLNKNREYYPLFMVDELSFHMKDLVEVKADMESINMTIRFRPVSVGKLRMLLIALRSTMQLQQFGFSDKDIDDVRGIFTDTNFYLLAVTFAVAGLHLLIDILAFKNDIYFWRHRRSMEGLSARTVLWSCVSHTVIFFYLMDEETSKLVLIPAGVGTIIEYWKLRKTWRMRQRLVGNQASGQERQTESFDSQGMKYLAYVLIPLCIGGAVYSLLYIPHKSWLSWAIQSMANGVYAFGFLFMLPQLFINYKLKSVAHLPWRAFMYKAFNTFIDDLFAFIIRMPTAHRVACFRDDVVFVIYLYQRWLYPVDKARVNEFGESFESNNDEKQLTESKKTK